MTIQTRRISSLPWNFPLNTRELLPGQSVSLIFSPSEGDYRYQITVIDSDSAQARCELPYRLGFRGQVDTSQSTVTESLLHGPDINEFGPTNPNWRWIPSPNRKER